MQAIARLPGVALALAVGILTGFARVSDNPLMRGLASAAIDAFRNVPLLLQVLIWYFLLSAMGVLSNGE